MNSRATLRSDLVAALQRNVPAAELDGILSAHFPALDVFRERDDLIVHSGGETRRLLIRRVGPDRFRVATSAAASGSTNLLDSGGGSERDLDNLIDEIAAFAAE